MKIKSIVAVLLLCLLLGFTACAPPEAASPHATQNVQSSMDKDLDRPAAPKESIPTNEEMHEIPDTTRPYNKKPVENTIKAPFFDVFIQDGRLEPDDEFSWDMDTHTFLAEIYTSDLMKPESKSFQEHRNTLQEQVRCLTPPIEILFSDFDEAGSPQYYFDKDERLFMVCFFYTFSVSDSADALTFMASILADVAAYDHFFVPSDEEPPVDVNNENLANDLIKMRWYTPEDQQFFRITAYTFRDTIVFNLIIANHDFPWY